MKKVSYFFTLVFLILFLSFECIYALDLPVPSTYQPLTLDNQGFNELQQQLKDNPPVTTKGVYLTAYSAANPNQIKWVIEQAKLGRINTVVIDIKDDSGRLTIPTDNEVLINYGTSDPIIDNVESLVKLLKDNGVYTIARIVTFKDPYIASVDPSFALHLEDGTLFFDNSNQAWVDPYNPNVWEYVLTCAKEAVAVGFNEIQFDYIRFCTEKGIEDVVYDEQVRQGKSKTQAINEAMEYFYSNLKPYGVYVSADVFGAVIDNVIDQNSVGQIYADLALNCDYISPMIYPSHYGNGSFGLSVPDLYPYETIDGALELSNKVLEPLRQQGYHVAKVRPWLQDFTASYLRKYQKYDYEQVEQQIQACVDNNSDGYLLWNAANKYHLYSTED